MKISYIKNVFSHQSPEDAFKLAIRKDKRIKNTGVLSFDTSKVSDPMVLVNLMIENQDERISDPCGPAGCVVIKSDRKLKKVMASIVRYNNINQKSKSYVFFGFIEI